MMTGYIPKFPGTTLQEKVNIGGIDFFDTSFLESGLTDIVNFLKNNPKPVYELVSKGYKLYDIGLGSFLSEYQEENNRNSEQQNYQKISENSLPEGVIVPKQDGYFSFGGKYYLIVSSDKILSHISTQFLYKGMIIDSSLYTQDSAGKVDKLLS